MSIFANLAGGLNFLQSLFLVALFYDQPSWRRKNGAVKSNSQTSDRYTRNPWMSAIVPAHRLYTDTSSCKNRGCLHALVGYDHRQQPAPAGDFRYQCDAADAGHAYIADDTAGISGVECGEEAFRAIIPDSRVLRRFRQPAEKSLLWPREPV